MLSQALHRSSVSSGAEPVRGHGHILHLHRGQVGLQADGEVVLDALQNQEGERQEGGSEEIADLWLSYLNRAECLTRMCHKDPYYIFLGLEKLKMKTAEVFCLFDDKL